MLSKNGDEVIPSSSSKDIPSSSTTKKSVIDFEKYLNKIDEINWDEYIKNIDWRNESDIEEEDEIEVVAADIPSTSNTTDNSIKLNKFNQKKSVRTENINDGIQPCSSKTPIWANISQNGIQNHDLTQMPSTSAAPGSSNVLKVGLEYRRHLPPQMRHKHPYVAYKRFRDAFSDTLGTKYQPPGIDPSLYEIIKDRISHLLPSEEELRDPNSLPFKRYRKALSQELAKAYKTGELPEDDTLQYAILNHEIQMNEIIIDQIEDKHRIESDRIKERDKITRRMIEERYEVEKEKVEKQYETAVAQLAEKMIAENEEERRQLEAELAVIGEDGEVPANFNYLPNRKQLRRRTGNLNDSSSVIEHSDKIDPYVPIHQVHWIDPNDINNDLNIFNSVLQSFSDEGPFEKHLSMQIQEGKLVLDGKTFNRGLNQVMMIKSQTYGEFPAIMLSLCDSCITVRSIIKGDPRHITITRSDLENGRVRISKRTT